MPTSTQYAKFSGIGGGSGGGGGVTSLNGETGAVNIVAGTGITVTPAGQNITIAATGGSGTVTSVSVVTANGLAGTVATATTTPAITLSTTITGILQGNGTAISAATTGNLTDAGTDGIVVTGGTGAVLGSGTSLAQHVADTTHNGYLSSTDWNTFNGKQGAGNYITALTGDVTATGPGSVAATLATVNSNVGSFGSSTSIPSFTVNGKGLITAASGNVVIAPAGTLTGTTLASNVVTSSLTSLGVQSQALNMGTHLINAVVDPVSAQDAATKNYVDTVASGLQPIQGVQAATAGSNISGTYVNGAAGVGATFTTTSLATFVVDGFTFTTLGQRVLLKDQSSGFQNGVYSVTQLSTGVLPTILTRTLDYDTASDMNAGTLVPVINGTVNAQTSWLQTATITTVGTDALVFVEWTANPANYLLKANNLSDVASKSTSFNNLSPMTTLGDTIYGGASGTGTRLAIGSAGTVYTVSAGIPSWVNPAAYSGGAFFASSQVTTDSTAITSGTFTTFSNSPALSFTPSVTGTYKVYCGLPVVLAGTNTQAPIRIFNTTGGGTLLEESQGNADNGSGGSIISTAYIQSVYTLTAGVSYVFDIQGKILSGTSLTATGSNSPFYMFSEGVVTGTGALTMGAFGSTPNANAGSISASTLTLQPASASFPGGVSTATQTFAGAKSISTGGSTTAFNVDSPSFVFDSTNNALGIGNAPNSATFIDGLNTSGATKRLLLTGYGSASLVGMRTRLARNTSGSPQAVQAGDILGFYNAEGYGTSQFPATATGALTILAGETFTNTSNQTYVTINSTATGAVTSTEQFRVASTGSTIGPQSSPTGVHQVNGGVNYTTRTVTASTLTLDTTTTDYIVYTDSTSNAIALTLPTPTNGRTFVIQDKTGKAATNNITIKQHASETINGLTQIVLSTNYAGVTLTSDGTNWSAQIIPVSGQTLLTSGTTFTLPVNATPQTRWKFTIVGGGAAGGGNANTVNQKGAGGGAGGGAIVYATGITASSLTYAIGAAGTGSSNAAGGNGGNSSITINAVTYTSAGGTGGAASTANGQNGGAGGTTTNVSAPNVSMIGQNGGATGNSAAGTLGAQGGNSILGLGGTSVCGATSGHTDGFIGTGYGAGGGGSASATGTASTGTGGNGTQGAILAEYWN